MKNKIKNKTISVVLPCFNEEGNIEKIYELIVSEFNKLNKYDYEIIFIDNNSADNSRGIIKKLALLDKNVKAIFNVRNFGYIKSPYHGILNSSGDATILMCSDLQEPPFLIPEFISAWEGGYKVALAVKDKSDSGLVLNFIKKQYYRFLKKLSDDSPIESTTGFGLYDKSVIEILRKLNDPYPFLRGLITQMGFKIKKIPFTFQKRTSGVSKSNIPVLYDYMFLGLFTHTKAPLRLIFLVGVFVFSVSLLASLLLLIMKLLYWNSFHAGYVPSLLLIAIFGGLQLLFLGILAEYLGFVISKINKMPIVIEEERINFTAEDDPLR